mmetsp:Transcript_57227/g.100188  ORF Transcript_57227/g.100188 Transcript_57227/m.100188 type:complete len:229 (-) Transcript_57227:1839-2525(-)
MVSFDRRALCNKGRALSELVVQHFLPLHGELSVLGRVMEELIQVGIPPLRHMRRVHRLSAKSGQSSTRAFFVGRCVGRCAGLHVHGLCLQQHCIVPLSHLLHLQQHGLFLLSSPFHLFLSESHLDFFPDRTLDVSMVMAFVTTVVTLLVQEASSVPSLGIWLPVEPQRPQSSEVVQTLYDPCLIRCGIRGICALLLFRRFICTHFAFVLIMLLPALVVPLLTLFQAIP